MREFEKIQGIVEEIRRKTTFEPEVAIVLGSGLGDYANQIQVECEVDYHELTGFPISTVPGHEGKYIFGYVGETKVVCMKGRVHFYEGYPISDVVLPIRVMKLLGADKLFLTNASGGINQNFQAGDLMLLTDHVSMFVQNPLMGHNIDELGVRFPDMSEVYHKELQNIIIKSAREEKISIQKGVYAQLTGPSFESPFEIKLLQKLDVDAVGMSTVVEAIAANHMGMKICGISCICNMAAGISKTPLTHEEVQEAANQAAPKLKRLITRCVKEMKNV